MLEEEFYKDQLRYQGLKLYGNNSSRSSLQRLSASSLSSMNNNNNANSKNNFKTALRQKTSVSFIDRPTSSSRTRLNRKNVNHKFAGLLLYIYI